MNRLISAAAGAIAILGAGPALAQAEAPPASSDSQAPEPGTAAPGAQAQGEAQVAITSEDIDNFAKAVVKVTQIQDDASLSQAQKQSAMAAAVQQSGLDPAKFNVIAKTAQTDPELQQRIQTAIGQQGQ